MMSFVEIQERAARARALYVARYDEAVWQTAVVGSTASRAVLLQDAALAVCGSPYGVRSGVTWTAEEQAFLDLFV